MRSSEVILPHHIDARPDAVRLLACRVHCGTLDVAANYLLTGVPAHTWFAQLPTSFAAGPGELLKTEEMAVLHGRGTPDRVMKPATAGM